MSSHSRSLPWLVWSFLLLIMLAVTGQFVWTRIQPGRPNAAKPMLVYSRLSDFTLTNEFGRSVSLADLRGQVWIADIIFTRCAGPCPEMTRRMSELQAVLPAEARVKLVTLTTDPEFDTPPVLKKYAERFGADPARWYFLTGPKPQIALVATNGFKFTALEKEPDKRTNEVDLFIHSTIFMMVDKRGQVRGTFESSEPEFTQQVRAAVDRLLREH